MVDLFSEELDRDRYVWNAIETADGGLYFAQDRILHFDGARWRTFGSPDWQVTRGIAEDDQGNLWVAAYNEVGYFPSGEWETDYFVSVRDQIPSANRDFGQVWQLKFYRDNIWMATHTRLFRLSDDNIEVWEFDSRTQVVFHFTEQGIYYHKLGEGLFRFDPDVGRYSFSKDPLVSEDSVMYFESYGDSNWLAISVQGMFVINGRGIVLAHHPMPIFKKAFVSSVVRLENGSFAIGTLQSGLILLSEDFEIEYIFNESNGAPSNIVLGMFQDSEQGLIAYFSNQLVRLELNRMAGQMRPGLHFPEGVLRYFTIASNGYYFGMDTGLYYKPLPEFGQEAVPYQLLARPVLSLKSMEGGFVLSAHFQDLFKWRFGELIGEVRMDREIRSIQPSRTFENRVYVLFSDGITSIDWNPDTGWGELRPVESLPISAERMIEDGTGTVWLSSPGSALVAVEFNEIGSVENLVDYKELGSIRPDGGNLVKIAWKNSILAFQANQIVVREGEHWVEIPQLIEWKDLRVRFAVKDRLQSNKVWLYLADSQTGDGRIWSVTEGVGGQLDVRPFYHSGIETTGVVRGIEVSAFGETIDIHLWGSGGILNINESVHKQVSAPKQPMVTSWVVDGQRVRDHDGISIPFDYGEMSILFSSSGFSAARPFLYQTRLGDADWGAPVSRPSRELGRLFEGRHKLEIRAIDANGRISDTTTLAFTILPPWYRTWWAYLSYIISLAVMIWAIIHYRESQLIKRKEELEAIVSQRTLELEKASRIKSDFIANMSHEIRNPLNGVIGLISRLKPHQPIPEQHRNALNRAAQYLQATVEEVLDFSRIESGRINFESVVFDPVDILQGVIEIYGERAAAKGLPLTFHSRNPTGFHVRSDPSKVQQIAGNLVGNAVKFTSRGSVHLGFSLEALSDDQGIMKFWVEDTGPGIPADEQKLVFEKYYQSESMDNNLRKRGTGLGLSLCRDFVENMGGAIRLRSVFGEGSTFSISLPVILEVPSEEANSTQASGDTFERKVLVVEDLEYNRLYLEDVLKDIGCYVVSCADGESGLELALNQDWDLIFLDWDLPKITGLEIARRLRKSDQHRSETVIVGMTAFATVETRNACLDAGMDHFLTKPLQEDKITGVVFTVKSKGDESRKSPQPKSVPWMSFHALDRLAGMKKVPVKQEIARYLDIVDELSAEIEKAIAALDWEEAGHRVHALLGHTGLITCAALTGVILDFQTVVHARDEAALNSEWQRVIDTIEQLKQYMTKSSNQATIAK